jgi:hypothetical protein
VQVEALREQEAAPRVEAESRARQVEEVLRQERAQMEEAPHQQQAHMDADRVELAHLRPLLERQDKS